MMKKSAMKHGGKIRENRVFHTINVILLVIISLICFLPFLNVISSALSTAGFDINFTPKGFTWFNFTHVFQDAAFWRALGVSFFVVVVGTAISVITMFSAAYALSKKDFPCRRGIMVFFIITMVFSGGMIPKIENALKAVAAGVRSVRIKCAEELLEESGTTIVNQ